MCLVANFLNLISLFDSFHWWICHALPQFWWWLDCTFLQTVHLIQFTFSFLKFLFVCELLKCTLFVFVKQNAMVFFVWRLSWSQILMIFCFFCLPRSLIMFFCGFFFNSRLSFSFTSGGLTCFLEAWFLKNTQSAIFMCRINDFKLFSW